MTFTEDDIQFIKRLCAQEIEMIGGERAKAKEMLAMAMAMALATAMAMAKPCKIDPPM